MHLFYLILYGWKIDEKEDGYVKCQFNNLDSLEDFHIMNLQINNDQILKNKKNSLSKKLRN